MVIHICSIPVDNDCKLTILVGSNRMCFNVASRQRLKFLRVNNQPPGTIPIKSGAVYSSARTGQPLDKKKLIPAAQYSIPVLSAGCGSQRET